MWQEPPYLDNPANDGGFPLEVVVWLKSLTRSNQTLQVEVSLVPGWRELHKRSKLEFLPI
jgi:hypothetical protein